MAWEDLTPLYVDAYHKVAAGGSPSYTARGVFEGTEANATAACDDEPTCLNTFSAGNDKWWMVCTERGTETGALCPDAFAPVGSSSCEQLQWSKDAQRDFIPSTTKEECEAQRKYLKRDVQPAPISYIMTDTNQTCYNWELIETEEECVTALKAVSYTHLTLPTICSV